MKPAKLAVPESLRNLKRWHAEVSARPSAQGLTMRLTVIGCGDAFGSGGRFNTCFMVESGRRDHPARLRRVVAGGAEGARRRSRTRIDGVVLSHLHGDHFGALPFLLLDCAIPQPARAAADHRSARPARASGSNAALRGVLSAFEPERLAVSASTSARSRPACRTKCSGLPIATTEVIHQSGAPSTAVRLTRRRQGAEPIPATPNGPTR